MTFLRNLTFLFALACLTSCHDSAQDSVAKKEVKSRNTQDGVAELTDEILADPNNSNLYIKRALAYQKQLLFDLAIRDVERAIAINGEVSYFHQVLGELYFKSGDLKAARLSLEKSVEFDNENTDALLKLGEVNFLQRRYEEGLKSINDALRVNDKLAQGYFIKGYIYKELGDTTLAVSSFQTATEVNPEHFEAFMELGNILAYQGDPLALEYFETALSIKPSSAQALYNKGMFLQSGDKFDEALLTYRKLISVDADNFLGYYNSGYIYMVELMAFDTAMAYFDTVLTIDPTYVNAYYNKGLCLEELDQDEEAVLVYQEILQTDPQHSLAAMGLERLLE